MSKKEPWQTHWREDSEVWRRHGGFGSVVRVLRNNDASGEVFALKRLKNSAHPHFAERRARMYREVVALETTPTLATPKVIDHNCALYRDKETPLYAVFEFVDGPTLEEHVGKNGRLTLDQALTMSGALLDTIEAFHDSRTGHRDIKPDNIILRNGDPLSPVLVDFGQTFNLDTTDECLTFGDEQVGNRFLWLPEHAPGSLNKRDLRSDITFIVGVLFFALTGAYPSTPLDDQQRHPHQRKAARQIIDEISEPMRTRAIQLFDIGFQYVPDKRWQTAAALRDAIKRLNAKEETLINLDDRLALVRHRASLLNDNKNIMDAIDAVIVRLIAAGKEAAALLGDGYKPSIERKVTSVSEGEIFGWVRCGINAFTAGKMIDTTFKVVAVGSEIVIEDMDRKRPRSTREIRARLPISDPQADCELKDRIVALIVENVARSTA